MPDFFWQQTPVVHRDQSRVEALTENLSPEHHHLHIGCTDWPIFDAKTNLHMKWLKAGLMVDGMDVDQEGIGDFRAGLPGIYFTSIDEIGDREYACIMIPDVIEHVGNVEEFLAGLSKIDAAGFALSTPNAYKLNSYIHDSIMYEEVHPDHNYWFTPYTLVNCIHKFTHWKVTDVLLVENETCMIARGLCR